MKNKQNQAIIGYDPGTPDGDKSTIVMGHKDKEGRVIVDKILKGQRAEREAKRRGII